MFLKNINGFKNVYHEEFDQDSMKADSSVSEVMSTSQKARVTINSLNAQKVKKPVPAKGKEILRDFEKLIVKGMFSITFQLNN